MENVYFVAVCTRYYPENFLPMHLPVYVTLEKCAEIINAKYIAVTDQNCLFCKGTEKWLRIVHNRWNWRSARELAKRGQYYQAFVELKTKISWFFELWFVTRSLLKDINNNATRIIIYLDFIGNASFEPLQIFAVWFSAFSSLTTRNKTIVWTHFHRTDWQGTKIGRFVRHLFNIFPVKAWRTAYTAEIAAENREYGWETDILPMPLNPDLSAFMHDPKSANKLGNKKSDNLVCWLVIHRQNQGLELLQRLIDHRSAGNFPNKFIKCFVSERASIKGNSKIDLVRIAFGADDYHLRFNEAEVVLLPYNAHSFGGSMSMLFVEAVATSKIPIVSDETVMASELRRFGLGELVMDFNKGFSWSFINQIREDASIRARLNLMAEIYVKEHDTFACARSLYKGLKNIDSKMPLSDPKRA